MHIYVAVINDFERVFIETFNDIDRTHGVHTKGVAEAIAATKGCKPGDVIRAFGYNQDGPFEGVYARYSEREFKPHRFVVKDDGDLAYDS